MSCLLLPDLLSSLLSEPSIGRSTNLKPSPGFVFWHPSQFAKTWSGLLQMLVLMLWFRSLARALAALLPCLSPSQVEISVNLTFVILQSIW